MHRLMNEKTPAETVIKETIITLRVLHIKVKGFRGLSFISA